MLTVKVTVGRCRWAVPGEMPVAQPGTTCPPASSLTVWSGPLVKAGAPFTVATSIVKVWAAHVSLPPLAVPPSSTACTVTVATPLASGAGV